MPKLIIYEKDKTREFSFTDRITLGRDSSNMVKLKDMRASRYHAVLLREEGGYVLEDLHSRNGTFLNGERLQGRLGVTVDDEIRIGDTTCQLEEDEPAVSYNTAAFRLNPETLTTETGQRIRLLDESAEEDLEVLRRARHDLAMLFQLGNLLHSGPFETKLFDQIAELVQKTTHADTISVIEVGAEGALLPRATRGDYNHYGSVPFSSTVIEQVLSKGRSLLIPDTASDQVFDKVKSIVDMQVRSVMCVPLRSRTQIYGLIFAASRSGIWFDEYHLQLLTAVGIQAGIAFENKILFQRTEGLFFGIVDALTNALDAKDPYTAGHSRRVASLSVLLGEEMGLPPGVLKELRLGALLHDIGKIGVLDSLLLSSEVLNKEEKKPIHLHPLVGAEILRPIERLDVARDIVRHHHERWDGEGYPDGLAGEDIPLASRIVCVADSLDAMTTDRPYRSRRTLQEAAQEIQRCAGTQFDPQVAEVFLRLFQQGRINLHITDG